MRARLMPLLSPVVILFFFGAPHPSSAFGEEPLRLEDILSSDILYYASAPDIPALKSGFMETPLGSLLSGEKPSPGATLVLNLVRWVLERHTGASIDTWLEHLSSPISLVILNPLAVPPAQEPPGVIFCRLRKGGKEFRDFLDKTILPTVLNTLPQIEIEAKTVGEYTFEQVRDNKEGKTWALAILGDFLMIGSVEAVQMLLQHRKEGVPPLSQSPSYQAATQRALPGSQLSSYFNVAALIGPLKEQAAGGDLKGARELEASGLPSLNDISSSMKYSGGQASERVFLRRSEAEPVGFAMIFTEPKPRALLGGRIVPSHFPLFVSLNLENGLAVYDGFRKTLLQAEGDKGMADLEQGRQWIENAVGVSIEQDVLANLTGEVVFAMDAPTFKESLLTRADKPPRDEFIFILALSMQNPDVLRNSLKQFLNSQFAWDAGLKHEVFPDEQPELVQVTNTRRGDKGVAYTFFDGFLVFSNSADTLRALPKAQAGEKTLADDPVFQEWLKPYEKGQNFIAHLDVQKFTQVLFEVAEQFAEPTAQLALKEFKPLIPHLRSAFLVGAAEKDGFVLDIQSTEGAGLHALGIIALVEGIKNSPGARVIRARRNMERIRDAIETYYVDNGSFPPKLDALLPKYLDWLPNDPFGPNGIFQYHPGPARYENDKNLYTTGWILVSPGPDRRLDLPLNPFDFQAFQKRLNSNDPEDERFLCRALYQFKPDRFPLENRVLDQGDLFLMGTVPH